MSETMEEWFKRRIKELSVEHDATQCWDKSLTLRSRISDLKKRQANYLECN